MNEHCPPEALLDLAEGQLVDVQFRRHSASCHHCGGQVTALRSTLAGLGQVPMPEPPLEYWVGFHRRVFERIEREQNAEVQRAARRRRSWLKVAGSLAALVVAALLVERGLQRGTEETPAPSELALLPAPEDDLEYQFLVILSESVDLGEAGEWLSAGEHPAALDLASFTAEEERRLLSEIRRGM